MLIFPVRPSKQQITLSSMLRLCTLHLCILSLLACTNKGRLIKYELQDRMKPVEPQEYSTAKNRLTSLHKDTWSDYIPDTTRLNEMPVKTLRVNFHIMNPSDPSRAIAQDHGRRTVIELLKHANSDLDTNVRNWRSPEGTAVLPRRYRYKLWPQPGDDGIYFHTDDSLYYYVVSGRNQNNYTRTVIDKYGIGLDTIINVFIQVHHPDSLQSRTYKASGQAIALGTDVKLSGIFELGRGPVEFRGMFNHEIGHVLGLAHAWMEDGCPDTNNHPNRCYDWTPDPPCNDLATNNMMDYNAYEIAVTPCQIGKMHKQMAQEGSHARAVVIQDWCTKYLTPVYISDTVVWNGSRDLASDLVIRTGGHLTIRNRVSLPEGAKIIVEPNATLMLDGCHLHNSCNKPWQGIFARKNKSGSGKIEAMNGATLIY